jgi:hypothetical protein
MISVASQIWILLLIAFAIGLFVGWRSATPAPRNH